MVTKYIHGMKYSVGYRYRRNLFVNTILEIPKKYNFIDSLTYEIDMYTKPAKLNYTVNFYSTINNRSLILKAY